MHLHQMHLYGIINSNNSAVYDVLVAKRSIILIKIYFNAIEYRYLFYGVQVYLDKYYRSFCFFYLYGMPV